MTTAALTPTEIAKLLAAGVNELTLNSQLADASWGRDDFLEMYDEYPDAFDGNAAEALVPFKKGTVFCPICNEVKWNKALNAHIFKCHMTELLAPFNKEHNKHAPIQHITVPLQIITPVFDNEKPDVTNIVAAPQQTDDDINDASKGHGQADRFLNPKTNRMKLIEKKRPYVFSKKDCPTLQYCLCCSKAWTSEKPARKHFFNTDGTPTECTSAKQLVKLNYLRGLNYVNYETHASIKVNVPNLTHFAAVNKEVELLEAQQTINAQKKKLTKWTDMKIEWDKEKAALLRRIEKLEGQIEAEPACCPSCLRKDLHAHR